MLPSIHSIFCSIFIHLLFIKFLVLHFCLLNFLPEVRDLVVLACSRTISCLEMKDTSLKGDFGNLIVVIKENGTARFIGLSELEGHLLVPDSTKANAFCVLHGSFFPIFFLLNSRKAFAFVESGTRRCPSNSDRPIDERDP